jgi:hypothetical protein
MLLRLVLLSFFRDLSGVFPGSFSQDFHDSFLDDLDVDLSSLFIVSELPHRV